jgi:hypothetical protein
MLSLFLQGNILRSFYERIAFQVGTRSCPRPSRFPIATFSSAYPRIANRCVCVRAGQALILACSFRMGRSIRLASGEGGGGLYQAHDDVYVLLFHHLLEGTYLTSIPEEEIAAETVESLCILLYDETINAVLHLLGRLDLTAFDSAEATIEAEAGARQLAAVPAAPLGEDDDGTALHADPTAALKPRVPKDFVVRHAPFPLHAGRPAVLLTAAAAAAPQVLVHLVDFVEGLLASTRAAFFERWHFIYCSRLVQLAMTVCAGLAALLVGCRSCPACRAPAETRVPIPVGHLTSALFSRGPATLCQRTIQALADRQPARRGAWLLEPRCPSQQQCCERVLDVSWT